MAQLVEPVADIDRTVLEPLDSLTKLRILKEVANVFWEVEAVKEAPIKTIMENLLVLKNLLLLLFRKALKFIKIFALLVVLFGRHN